MGVTIVLITHDMSVVRGIADRMAIMENGHIVETGTVHEVFANPKTEVGRRFATTALRDVPIGRERDSVNQSAESAAARLITITINDGVDLGALAQATRPTVSPPRWHTVQSPMCRRSPTVALLCG